MMKNINMLFCKIYLYGSLKKKKTTILNSKFKRGGAFE